MSNNDVRLVFPQCHPPFTYTFSLRKKQKMVEKGRVNNKLRCQWIDNFLPTKSNLWRYSSLPQVEDNGSTRHCSSSYFVSCKGFHVGGTCTWGKLVETSLSILTPIYASLGSRSSPKAIKCRFVQKIWAGVLLPSVEILWLFEQKQTLRDSCSIAVSRHSEDKIGQSHSEGQEHPPFRGHKIRTWKLIACVH